MSQPKYKQRGMPGMKMGIFTLMVILFTACTSQPEWPQVKKEHKPWTRWWWMGSAVDKENLTRELELFRKANLGGVEITPIYGVAGYEDQFVDYLSPEWMDMLSHTLAEGERLNLGIDMATGTGWPFGGPWIQENEASRRLYYITYKLNEGESLDERISYMQEPYLRTIGNTIYELHGFLKAEDEAPEGTVDEPLKNPAGKPLTISDVQYPLSENESLQELAIEQVRFGRSLPLVSLMAYSEKGETTDLTDRVDQAGYLDWNAPAGEWTLYAVFSGWHGKTVERAAPGGEGWVIDHFSEAALQRYLSVFDSSFAGHDIGALRSFFNDSYEVDDAEGEANWTPHFFREFKKRRRYDLKEHLPALLEETDTEKGRRVLTDYRETISDLLLEKFTQPWDSWAEDKGAMIRNQAHGSPANILDLYATSDIPETEGTDILRAKMASSAANVTGKPLVSSESATWLSEHFTSTLSDVKVAVDRYFVSGVNHIFYHGSAYSLAEDEWPGWLFYAAVHFNDRNPFWDHFKDFNNYVTRVQSFLQSGNPDNDVLMYYPIHDQWAEPGYGLLRHFDGGLGENLDGSPLKEGAEQMVELGYSFDFISDRQLHNTNFNGKVLETEGGSYRTIVVPQSRYIPLETFNQLVILAEEGATVIAYDGLPEGVPGLNDLPDRQATFDKLVGQLSFDATSQTGIDEAVIGNGRFLRGDSLDELLAYAGVRREKMTDSGLQFVRRSYDSGQIYFITNRGDDTLNRWIPLAKDASSAAIFDPVHETTGYARVRTSDEGNSEIYLQLREGESLIIKTYETVSRESSYPYFERTGQPYPINGTWSLDFIAGGPELPEEVELDSLKSWTQFEGGDYQIFSGTGRYSIKFVHPGESKDGWLLSLGEVNESARILLNGQKIGTLIGPEYEMVVPAGQLQDMNELEIEVSNLMVNRIVSMEREKKNWKKFYNVNFPAWQGANRNEMGLFDASHWEPQASGLVGPVTLTPVKLANSEQ